MKKLIFSLLFISAIAWAQNPIMDKYENDEAFTRVSISPKMFQLIQMTGVADEDPEIAELISGLESLKILVFDKEESQKYNPLSLYSEATKSLIKGNFEELMDIKDGGDNVKFLINDNGKFIEELLMLVGSTDEFVMINITGNIDLEQIGKLSESIDVKGLDHLKKIDDEK